MKTLVCHGVIGIIVITMGTILMVVYNNSFTDTSEFHSEKPGKAQPKPPRALSSTLEGYTGLINQQPLRKHCNCCALVSSSGHLTGSNRGDEIDRTECVIRMNNAPNGNNFKQDVGRRTSLRVIAHSSLQRVLQRRQELLNTNQDSVFLFWGPTSSMRRDGKGRVFNNLRLINQLLPKLKIYVISPLKMLEFDELFKNETGKDRKLQKHYTASQDDVAESELEAETDYRSYQTLTGLHSPWHSIWQTLPTAHRMSPDTIGSAVIWDILQRGAGMAGRKTSKSWLTTGWFTMAIALELCDRVNVYGMVAPDFCSTPSHLSVPYHYYEPSGPDECSLYLSHEHNQSGGHHSFITEKTVFANWAQKYDIHFYQPDWSPSSTLNGSSSHTPATAVS
ncbi:alpha-N-acetylgalactosaminide alpha-2,6-sialyltransferase 5-like isoform X1 [Oncorhynchus kisutch]|uniref:Alpha-N-acetylgalactosaminide alpha-2,6-sialyltransferase 5-like n=1 Tax=Oncorhynchus kisutch TaxID=8019 RepID=A0A8C7CU02_ONCKI|nr:alpha-N-acetylgalactosaminide alpha-2,6-sialyltransferase 5-like isoform X1 [Oncorhynchus kisutch]